MNPVRIALLSFIALLLLLISGFVVVANFQQNEDALKGLADVINIINARERSLPFVSESEVRKLGGQFVIHQKDTMMYFRSYTRPKTPGEERTQVPIASVLDVIEELKTTVLPSLGPRHIPLSISQEIGIYEGKLATMAVIVTLPAP